MAASRRVMHPCRLFVTCAFVAMVTIIPLTAQRERPLEFSVFDGRPLAAVIDQLEARYGWIITYEDPPYEAAGDVDDVTSEVARGPNSKVRVLVPRRRRFDFKYPNGDRARAEDVLAAVIRDYNMAGNNDRFRLLRTGRFFHVVPSVSDNKIGLPTDRQSRLDVRVTIPDTERSVFETLELVVAHVRELTGVPVMMGRVPTNFLMQQRLRTGATNEPARDVLVRALTSTGRDFSWRLKCDPGVTKLCIFTVHLVKPPE